MCKFNWRFEYWEKDQYRHEEDMHILVSPHPNRKIRPSRWRLYLRTEFDIPGTRLQMRVLSMVDRPPRGHRRARWPGWRGSPPLPLVYTWRPLPHWSSHWPSAWDRRTCSQGAASPSRPLLPRTGIGRCPATSQSVSFWRHRCFSHAAVLRNMIWEPVPGHRPHTSHLASLLESITVVNLAQVRCAIELKTKRRNSRMATERLFSQFDRNRKSHVWSQNVNQKQYSVAIRAEWQDTTLHVVTLPLQFCGFYRTQYKGYKPLSCMMPLTLKSGCEALKLHSKDSDTCRQISLLKWPSTDDE